MTDDLVGGECSYWACMPTKALLRDAAAVRAARALPAAGQALSGHLNPATVLARRDRFAADWSDNGQVEWLQQAGITLVRGHGRISDTRTVTVTGADTTTVLRARQAVVIATGSSARIPPDPITCPESTTVWPWAAPGRSAGNDPHGEERQLRHGEGWGTVG